MNFNIHMPDLRLIYPIEIAQTRYGGTYEGGAWAAFPQAKYDRGCDAFGHDLACSSWWDYHREEVGLGATPNEAVQDLLMKLKITTSEG